MNAQSAAQKLPPEYERAGNIVTLQLKTGTLRLELCSDAMARVLFYSGTLQLHPQPWIVKTTWPAVEFTVRPDGTGDLTIATARMRIVVEGASGALVFQNANGRMLVRESAIPEPRVLTPAVKYWVCKTAPALIYEAMECLGGNGYVEESVLPRLYREAPVNAIWEGSGNVMCLDVLRALGREPQAAEMLLAEIGEAAAADRRLAVLAAALAARLTKPALADETQARSLTRDLVLALQGALLVRHGPPALADAFCVARLGEERGGAFGTLPHGVDAGAIVARAAPVLH